MFTEVDLLASPLYLSAIELNILVEAKMMWYLLADCGIKFLSSSEFEHYRHITRHTWTSGAANQTGSIGELLTV
jgi:hypothetical protein